MKKKTVDGGMGLGYMVGRFNPTVQLTEYVNEFGEDVSEGDDED